MYMHMYYQMLIMLRRERERESRHNLQYVTADEQWPATTGGCHRKRHRHTRIVKSRL